jgi:hypothetical protein
MLREAMFLPFPFSSPPTGPPVVLANPLTPKEMPCPDLIQVVGHNHNQKTRPKSVTTPRQELIQVTNVVQLFTTPFCQSFLACPLFDKVRSLPKQNN